MEVGLQQRSDRVTIHVMYSHPVTVLLKTLEVDKEIFKNQSNSLIFLWGFILL
jgi:hypothetical protein